jgi:peptidoglycan/LPS O-acetylase OafA/YrhL
VLGYLLLLLGTVAIFYAVLGVNLRIPDAIIYLGKISYGLYLFHDAWIWAVFARGTPSNHFFLAHRWFGAAVALLATTATAAISYHSFEKPILRYKRRFEAVKTRAA